MSGPNVHCISEVPANSETTTRLKDLSVVKACHRLRFVTYNVKFHPRAQNNSKSTDSGHDNLAKKQKAVHWSAQIQADIISTVLTARHYENKYLPLDITLSDFRVVRCIYLFNRKQKSNSSIIIVWPQCLLSIRSARKQRNNDAFERFVIGQGLS